MHLSVNARVTHLDLEGAHVTPGVVPGVDAEPVVLAVLGTPADSLDGVTAEGATGGVLIDTRLVGKEVFVHGESRGDGTVLLDLSLDVVNATDAIAASGEVLVIAVGASGVIDARLRAGGSDLLDIIAGWEDVAGDVMGALLHGVVVAGVRSAEVTSSDDTGVGEPFPGRADLTTVAAHRLAVNKVAAGSGVRDGEESGELTLSGDADTVVQSLGGTVGPA